MEAEIEEAASSSTAGLSNKLFLGGLSWQTTEDTIRAHFSPYGEVTEVIVMRDRLTNKPRGFGFITFKDQEAADNACNDTHTLDGRTIDAKRSLPHGQHSSPKSKKIFVGGLAPETNEENFKQHFERFGKVVEAQIMVDHTSGRSRGFGFITFEDEDSVAAVFSAGSMQELNGKKVEVKAATPKGSGPIGRGPGLLPGRGLGFGPGREGLMGRYPEGYPYGMGPTGYPMPAGYMPMPGYGGYMPYPGAFPGMMMAPGYSGYPYPGYPYGFSGAAMPAGYSAAAMQQQHRAPSLPGAQQQQRWPGQQLQQQPAAAAAAAAAAGKGQAGLAAKRGMPQRSSSDDVLQQQDAAASSSTKQQREAAAAAVAAAAAAPP
uniref:RRM domain-containing protein n=1 Tax=Tetradesmus obliquus TaxID=3088 RepID=A0A383VZF2_TETOB|eukprot:jgi/Sobl393_1/12057/SZX70825.1